MQLARGDVEVSALLCQARRAVTGGVLVAFEILPWDMKVSLYTRAFISMFDQFVCPTKTDTGMFSEAIFSSAKHDKGKICPNRRK